MMSYWGGRGRGVTIVAHDTPLLRHAPSCPSLLCVTSLGRCSITSLGLCFASSRPSAHLVDARQVVKAQGRAQLPQLTGVLRAREREAA